MKEKALALAPPPPFFWETRTEEQSKQDKTFFEQERRKEEEEEEEVKIHSTSPFSFPFCVPSKKFPIPPLSPRSEAGGG